MKSHSLAALCAIAAAALFPVAVSTPEYAASASQSSVAQLQASTAGNWTVGASSAPAAPAAPVATGTTYYVDCSATTGGSGSQTSPWNALGTVNSHVFQPGDYVLFNAGTTCNGALAPQGSGSSGKPIVIDQYGSSSTKPVIAGGGVPAAVSLKNQQYWEIRDLQVTNVDPNTSTWYSQQRRGVVVALQDFGQANYFRLIGLNVHDVYGENKKDLGGSGGIQFEIAASSTASAQVKSSFNDVLIANNIVNNVNRSGINMSTAWRCRPSVGTTVNCANGGLPWVPWTNLIIRGNTVQSTGGDGIVVQMNRNALVERNTVIGAANRANGSNAALWGWNSDGTVFQFNDVSATHKLSDNNDGEAFDADFGTQGTVYQYNFSHSNDGGMVLYCGCAAGGLSVAPIVRYNVSEGDQDRIQFSAGATQAEFYNNTIVLNTGNAVYLNNNNTQNGTTLLTANNLFIATSAIQDESGLSPALNDIVNRSNAYSGPGGAWPTDSSGGVVISQTLSLGAGGSMDRYRVSDSRLAQAGIPIAASGSSDGWGDAVPSTCKPDIGAFQFTAVSDNCGVSNASMTSGQSITTPVHPNETYKVTATLASGASLSVVNPRGFSTPAQSTGTVVFTTAMDATTVTVTCTGGSCGSTMLQPLTDLLFDRSFDSEINTPWSVWNTNRTSIAADVVSGSSALQISGTGSSEQANLPVATNTTYTLAGWVASTDGTEVRVGVKDSANASVLEKWAGATSSTMKYVSVSFNTGSSTSLTAYCYKPGGSGAGFCDGLSLTAN